MENLMHYPALIVRQRKEMAELFGFETRNKYEVLDEKGHPLLFCAEMQKGIAGFLWRQFLGHMRSFEIRFFNSQKQVLWKAAHPFRFIFQQLDVLSENGELLGRVEQRWSILRKRFTLTNCQTNEQMAIESGFFSFWTFPVYHRGREVAKIQKKWSGALKEMFMDADNFRVEFSPELNGQDRQIILSAAILVDLVYFERKAR